MLLEELKPQFNSGNWEYVQMRDNLRELVARRHYTPDLYKLQSMKTHLVFVYDNLKVNFSGHGEIRKGQFLGRAHSYEQYFMMRRLGGNCYAWRLKGKDVRNYKDMVAPIMGHVFALGIYDLIHLDAVFENGVSFKREKAWFNLYDQRAPMKSEDVPVTQECWIYCATPTFRSEASVMSTGMIKSHITYPTYRYNVPVDMWDWRREHGPN